MAMLLQEIFLNYKFVMRFDIRTGFNLLHTTLDIMKVEDIHKNIVLTFVNMCLMGNAQQCSISIIE